MDLPRLKIGNDVKTMLPVCITDRHIHCLLMGKSGTGKSTSIANWWEQDNYYGNAKILVDPSGSLSRDCYSISKGIYCSLDHDVSINPMVAPYTESQISDILAEGINQVVTMTTPNEKFTVKMRELLDDAVKNCLRLNRKSLVHVLDWVKNMHGHAETRDGIIARISFILSDERMVKLLCGHNSIEWGEIIAKKQTFILDCMGMSREQMIMAGSIVTHGIKNYFRYARPKAYLPVALFIDEFHNFVNPSVFDILKEGRRYKLSATLATQDLALVDDKMARVMLNVGNIVSYRLGYREASLVAREIDIGAQDLQFIDKYHCAYLTPKARGIAKAPRPPIFKRLEPPKTVEPPRQSWKGWWTAESSQAI